MVDVTEVLVHWYAGRSQYEIADSLGLDRRTVRKYTRPAIAAGFAPGGPPVAEQVWVARAREWFPQLTDPRLRQSSWLAIGVQHERISDWLAAGVSVATIHQRLRDEHGLSVSESSLRRYVEGNLAAEATRASVTVLREDPPPGQEAQVDYGLLGRWYDPAATRWRRVWAFVMVLATSRYLFVRPVLVMDQRAWTECHVAAFEFFGGSPERIVLDNLTTGVTKADLYDPKLNRSYAELAAHYGVLLDPARRAKPKDKPRCERQVPFVRGSFWRGREFLTLPVMRTEALRWCVEVAGARACRPLGGAAPKSVFDAVEAAALTPLPARPFELAEWCRPKVGPDIHLLTEPTVMSPHVSGPIGVSGPTVPTRGRRRGRAPRSGGVGRSHPGFVAGDGQRVGAVSVDRPGGDVGGGGCCLLPRSAGRGTQPGHRSLVWDGFAAVVPVPVGRGGVVGSGEQGRGS